MKVGIVLGTRPEIIKNYSIVKAFRSLGVKVYVLHTHQHQSKAMSDAIFAEMGYEADYALNQSYRLGTAINWVTDLIKKLHLDLILVNGDTAAAVVGSMAAMYEGIKIAHVEAGLRSFDPQMLEERNRIMVDSVSHFLLTYTEFEADYLKTQSQNRGKVIRVGNTTVDVISDFSHKFFVPPFKDYAFVTLHRKELTDDASLLCNVLTTIDNLSSRFSKIIFPIHPRTRDVLARAKIRFSQFNNIYFCEPFTAIESLSYIKNARLIITDSGCVQEEAYLFHVPCVTLRENTERHLTVQNKANIVTGFERNEILESVDKQLREGPRIYPDIYGSPGAGMRIVKTLLEELSGEDGLAIESIAGL